MSVVSDSVTAWIVTPLSVVFSRHKYWGGLPLPSPGDLPDLRVEPTSLVSPALADSFPLCPPGCYKYGYTNISLMPCFQLFLGVDPEVELLNHTVILFLIKKNYNTVFRSSCSILHSYQQCTWVPVSSYPCQHLMFSVTLIVAILSMGIKWHIIVFLICIYLVIGDFEHLSYLYLSFIYLFFGKKLFKSF